METTFNLERQKTDEECIRAKKQRKLVKEFRIAHRKILDAQEIKTPIDYWPLASAQMDRSGWSDLYSNCGMV